jgi:hypothetical protein
MLIGVAEDSVRQPTLVEAKVEMDLLVRAGFNAVRVTQTWAPGETAPSVADQRILRNVVQAARLDGVQVLLTVMNFGNRTTPLTEQARGEFAAYVAALASALPQVRYFVIGNEPNINRYWLPQFSQDGTDAAAPAYEALLAQAYDALKAVSPKIVVLGGALSPHGGDDPDSIRPTHSPTAFLTDLGAAYRASDRTRPIMDGLAHHPYEDNSASRRSKASIRTRPRSRSPTTTSWSRCLAPSSPGRRSRGRHCRSTTTSSVSRRRSRRRRRASTRDGSR